MNLLKYFGFYQRMTGGRLTLVAALALTSVMAQMLAAAAFLSISMLGGAAADNRVTAAMDWLMAALGISQPHSQLLFLLCFCCAAFLVSGAALVGSNWFSSGLEAEIRVRLQHDIARSIFKARYEYFLSHNVGFFNNAILNEMHKVSSSFKFYVEIFTSVLFAGMFFSMAMLSNPKVIAALAVIGVPFMLVNRWVNKRSKGYSIKNTAEYGRLHSMAFQLFSHLKYLKATGTFDSVLAEFRERSRALSNIIKHQTNIACWSVEGIRPFAMIVICAVIYLTVVFMDRPIIESVTMMGLLYMSYQKMTGVQSTYQKFLQSAGGILMYEDMTAALAAAAEPGDGVGAPPDFDTPLRFENVVFKYKSGAEPVLKELSFEIPAKSSVAFVGDSGSGKSTIVNLVVGLLPPSSGRITLGGKDLHEIDIAAMRAGVGYVTQESVIFNDSVRSNLTLWDPLVGMDKVADAAAKAKADEFISAMPKGYDSLLGDHGLNISGGQRQRVTIARELVRDTPMLILDEATSALDSETERKIQDSVDAFRGQKTIIVIAHRLSTVRNCDKIFVLDKGRIIESGSFDGLCAMGGRFKEMMDRQSMPAA